MISIFEIHTVPFAFTALAFVCAYLTLTGRRRLRDSELSYGPANSADDVCTHVRLLTEPGIRLGHLPYRVTQRRACGLPDVQHRVCAGLPDVVVALLQPVQE